MAQTIRSSSQMTVRELKLAEEKYQLYMEGQKKRIWPFRFEVRLDCDHAIDAIRYAVQQLKNIRDIKTAYDLGRDPSISMIMGGVSHGKTALMEALMKDLYKHGMAIHVTKERSGSIEQTHIPFDALTYKLNFDPAMFTDLVEKAGGLPEKVQKDPLDEPENWLAPEPPKQKKFRSYQPDKRALNRKNRKKK